jgi:predicted transcriptional regulator
MAKKPVDKVGVVIRLNVDAHIALKVIAAKERRTLSSIAAEALNDFLKKKGESALVIDFSKS